LFAFALSAALFVYDVFVSDSISPPASLGEQAGPSTSA
jgi:hypothetical protein